MGDAGKGRTGKAEGNDTGALGMKEKGLRFPSVPARKQLF